MQNIKAKPTAIFQFKCTLLSNNCKQNHFETFFIVNISFHEKIENKICRNKITRPATFKFKDVIHLWKWNKFWLYQLFCWKFEEQLNFHASSPTSFLIQVLKTQYMLHQAPPVWGAPRFSREFHHQLYCTIHPKKMQYNKIRQNGDGIRKFTSSQIHYVNLHQKNQTNI